MNTPPEILAIAQRRVDALVPTSLYADSTAAYARKAQLEHDLEHRGTSAVAQAELRLLTEALDALENEAAEESAAEIAAENGWLRAAEQGTPDDYAFEEYEARMGLRQPEDDGDRDCLGHPADHNGVMGETTYCDGSCRARSRS